MVHSSGSMTLSLQLDALHTRRRLRKVHVFPRLAWCQRVNALRTDTQHIAQSHVVKVWVQVLQQVPEHHRIVRISSYMSHAPVHIEAACFATSTARFFLSYLTGSAAPNASSSVLSLSLAVCASSRALIRARRSPWDQATTTTHSVFTTLHCLCQGITGLLNLKGKCAFLCLDLVKLCLFLESA